LSLVNTTFTEGAERNRAVAVWGAAGAAGLVIGVLLGGALTQTLGWEAVFFVNVPLAGVAVLSAFRLIPVDRRREVNRRFDLPGALSATVGVSLLVFALVQGPKLGWSSPAILVGAAASLLLVGVFAAAERRSSDPLVPPRLLANRNLFTAVVIAFLFWATFGSVLYFLTLYLQDVLGYNALETGAGFLLPTVVVVAGSAVAGRLTTRFGVRPTIVTALVVGACGALALGLAMSPEGSYVALIPGMIGTSIGDGIVFTAVFIAAGTGVSDQEEGVASGITSASTSIGAAVGLAVLVLVANAASDGPPGDAIQTATADGLRAAVLVVAGGIAVTALVALNLRRGPSHGTEIPCPRELTMQAQRRAAARNG
jgi:MFS family permease